MKSLLGVQREMKEQGAPSAARDGKAKQSPSDSGEVTLFFWQPPLEIWRPWGLICRVANIWQNNLLEAALREPRRTSWCLPRFSHIGSRSSMRGAGGLISQWTVPEILSKGEVLQIRRLALTHPLYSVCMPKDAEMPAPFLLSFFSFTSSIIPVYQMLTYKGKSAAH